MIEGDTDYMAPTSRKKTFLSKFLDMIGLVDNEQDEENETPERSKPAARTRRTDARRPSEEGFDEFADDGRRHMPRTTPRPVTRTAARPAQRPRASRVDEEGFGDVFDDDVDARRAARPGSGRTGSNQGYAAWSAANAARTDRARRASAPAERRDLGRPSLQDRYDEPETEPERYAPPREAPTYQRHQTVIFTLRAVDDCKDVIVALVDKKSVLLNLEKLDAVSAQRVVDMMAGATFAIDAGMSSAGNRTWLITPSTVDVERSTNESARY